MNNYLQIAEGLKFFSDESEEALAIADDFVYVNCGYLPNENKEYLRELGWGCDKTEKTWFYWLKKDKQPKKYTTPKIHVKENHAVVGGHYYPGCENPYGDGFYTSDCKYGCGCWMGACNSGGPDGIDPFGECPKAPKE
jgi:hypothetical protein